MANFCTKCGNPLEQCTCPKKVDVAPPNGFIAKMKNQMGIGEPEINATDTYESGMKIVPDNIRLNEGEIPVKQYDVAVLRTRLKFMRAEGRMQVTNKRLLFRATGRSIMGRTAIQHEFAIDQIGGVEIRKDYRFGIFEAILGLALVSLMDYGIIEFMIDHKALCWILGIIGLIPFFAIKKMFLLKMLTSGLSLGCSAALFTNHGSKFALVFATIALVTTLTAWFLFCFKPNLIFTIKTTGAVGAIEIRRKKNTGILSFIFGNNSSEQEEYTGYSDVMPWRETEIAIREIGAIITDIQKLGDFGVEKWKVN